MTLLGYEQLLVPRIVWRPHPLVGAPSTESKFNRLRFADQNLLLL